MPQPKRTPFTPSQECAILGEKRARDEAVMCRGMPNPMSPRVPAIENMVAASLLLHPKISADVWHRNIYPYLDDETHNRTDTEAHYQPLGGGFWLLTPFEIVVQDIARACRENRALATKLVLSGVLVERAFNVEKQLADYMCVTHPSGFSAVRREEVVRTAMVFSASVRYVLHLVKLTHDAADSDDAREHLRFTAFTAKQWLLLALKCYRHYAMLLYGCMPLH
jgi:hypothetical protein